MRLVGLVPCAGRGSRLGLPFAKEMLPDLHHPSYRPVLMYALDALREAGVRDVVLTINPGKGELIQYLGNGRRYGLNLAYCVHPEPRSLPESVDEAYRLLGDATVLFTMPDTVIRPSDILARLLRAHGDAPRRSITLGCFSTETPSRFGMVAADGSLVRRIDDKPQRSALRWMWGAIAWESDFTEALHRFALKAAEGGPQAREHVLTDAMAGLVAAGMVRACAFEDGTYEDLGTFESYVTWGLGRAPHDR